MHLLNWVILNQRDNSVEPRWKRPAFTKAREVATTHTIEQIEYSVCNGRQQGTVTSTQLYYYYYCIWSSMVVCVGCLVKICTIHTATEWI